MTLLQCGARHPERDLICRQTGPHEYHLGGHGPDVEWWPNEEFKVAVISPTDKQAKLRDMASRTARLSHASDARLAPRPSPATVEWLLSAPRGKPYSPKRGHDEWASHIAAERIEPHRDTRKGQVLAALRAARGAEIPGPDLATEECGGSEGLRRLRELRADDGWPIERRPDPGSDTGWLYWLPAEP